jgi:hypothetical protein
MQNTPQDNRFRYRRKPMIVRPSQPQRKKQFKWEIIFIPATVIFLVWFTSGIEPAGTWEEFLRYIGVHDKTRFSMLACLGLMIVAILAIARVIRDSKKG